MIDYSKWRLLILCIYIQSHPYDTECVFDDVVVSLSVWPAGCPSSHLVLQNFKSVHNFCLFPVALISVDVGNVSTRMSRFANYLRNLLPCNDAVVMEMAAKAVGVLALSSGTFAAEYVEFEVRRALEWLATDKSEGRRHAAVSG